MAHALLVGLLVVRVGLQDEDVVGVHVARVRPTLERAAGLLLLVHPLLPDALVEQGLGRQGPPAARVRAHPGAVGVELAEHALDGLDLGLQVHPSRVRVVDLQLAPVDHLVQAAEALAVAGREHLAQQVLVASDRLLHAVAQGADRAHQLRLAHLLLDGVGLALVHPVDLLLDQVEQLVELLLLVEGQDRPVLLYLHVADLPEVSAERGEVALVEAVELQ
mmetsp:Transcript_13491/g.38376  ORF Transcript_13491/g.38376 Transcript_13491/m.38376 type:complete len:220 (+) Transcript_13491:993-1652(+)